GCRARFECEIDFGELPVGHLGNENRAALTAGSRLETTLPDAGVRAWFRLFTGADERRLPLLRRRRHPLGDARLARARDRQASDGPQVLGKQASNTKPLDVRAGGGLLCGTPRRTRLDVI